MAKITGPLLSETAHGSVGKLLTFSKRKSGQQVRGYNKPRKIPSPKQRGQRRLTEFLVAQWQNMSDVDKATWDARARVSGLNIAGYHYFLREAQRDLYTHHGLVGYWHCNEIVGGKVLDLSGNANHGTLKPDYPTNAPVLVDSRSSKFGKALLCDGVDEFVEVPSSPSLEITDKLSLLIWFKPRIVPFASNGVIAGKQWTGDFDLVWGFLINNGASNLRGQLVVDSVYRVALGITTLKSDVWYFAAMTYNRVALILYLDGIYEDDVPTITPIRTTSDPFRFGAELQPSKYFDGVIDEVCVYNRPLSAAEIVTRYKFGR